MPRRLSREERLASEIPKIVEALCEARKGPTSHAWSMTADEISAETRISRHRVVDRLREMVEQGVIERRQAGKLYRWGTLMRQKVVTVYELRKEVLA